MDPKTIALAIAANDENQIKSIMAAETNGYQVYNPFVDPIALEPGGTTESKEKLYQFSRKDFEGKSVSDLGCNLGAFSFLALNYGASRVIAYEHESKFKNFLDLLFHNYQGIFPQYYGKLETVQLNLNTLPKIPKTDIVMANSIIHWLFVFNDKITMAEVATWLAEFDAVYFEGCVTADEPIMKEYKVDINRFSENIFMREMLKHFTAVVMGRPSYNPNRLVAKFYKK